MQMVTTMVMIKIDNNYPIWQANKVKMKIPKVFPKIPGSKILENPVPKNPGIEILDPVRACPQGNTTAPSLPEKQWRGSFYKGPFLQPVHRTFKGMQRLPRVIKGDLQTSTLGWYWKREVDPPNLYQLFLCSFWSTIWENTWVFVIWVIFEVFVIFYTLSRF